MQIKITNLQNELLEKEKNMKMRVKEYDLMFDASSDEL